MRTVYKKYWDILQPIRPYRRNQLIKILEMSLRDKRKFLSSLTGTKERDIDTSTFNNEETVDKFIILLAVLSGRALN